MEVKKQVIVVLAVMALFLSVLSTLVQINELQKNVFTGAQSSNAQGVVSLQILGPPSPTPENFNCSIFNDHSINLTWDAVTGADNYTIYHSENISAIMTLDINNIPADVIQITGITNTNFTDQGNVSLEKRYYTISVFNSGVENLTKERALGKFTYQYNAPVSGTFGTLASNRISVYLNKTYTAETFLQEIDGSLNPTISRLDKSNASGEFFTTHVRGLSDGNNFGLELSRAYQLTVDSPFNHTICGSIAGTPYILEYDAPVTTQGVLASNLYGIYDYNKSPTAETFTQEIDSQLQPTISRLEKTDSSGEFLITHVRGLNDGNIFDINPGQGYTITVDQPFNHTLCTECFG